LWNSANPAWVNYGAPPAGDEKLRSFALAVLSHQAGDYGSAGWEDMRKYVADYRTYIDVADNTVPFVTDHTRRYYRNPPGFSSANPEPLMSYARSVFTDGQWPMRLLIVIPALSLVIARGRERQGAAI